MKKPNRPLGLIALTSLVVGNMIGSGIFLLPSSLGSLGTISLLSWIFTATGAVCLGYLFIKFNQHIPKTGGLYAYVHEGGSRFLSFQTAYCYWLGAWVGNCAMALASIGYATIFFPILLEPKMMCFAAIGIVWLFTFLNCFGTYLSGQIQWITLLLKLIPIVLIFVPGWWFVEWNYYYDYWNVTEPRQSNISAISQGVTLTLWAFIGLGSATIPVSHIEQPKINVPRATILGILITSFVYIFSSIVIMGMIPAETLQNSASPFALAAEIIFGNIGKYIVAIGAMIACLGSLNGWTLLQGQIAMAASHDRLFPKVFAKCNRYNVPALGLIVTGILKTCLILLTLSNSLIKQFEIILLLTVFATLVPYFYTSLTAILLRKKLITKNKKPLFLLINSFAIFYTSWAIFTMEVKILALGALLLLSSTPFYLYIQKSFDKDQ